MFYFFKTNVVCTINISIDMCVHVQSLGTRLKLISYFEFSIFDIIIIFIWNFFWDQKNWDQKKK